jgi:hypothetical protein
MPLKIKGPMKILICLYLNMSHQLKTTFKILCATPLNMICIMHHLSMCLHLLLCHVITTIWKCVQVCSYIATVLILDSNVFIISVKETVALV